ncbi:uncharacterized protein LOC133182263 [Saccostrea echinata]|uniref:uncharacterized protein LOC133182263 n=1 Tax=Saccostrea echinata TaxID=191078 RepID=UPI002A80D340|nr:uncharacterized protein LOC133182263 [Saccostrea echinata]
MERVVLLSKDEAVKNQVDKIKNKFEEKYHTCRAFREECLTGPEDSQRVAQTLNDESAIIIAVLDQTLHEILDDKKSRRLLNKIRDRIKSGRVVLIKYEIKEKEIQDFLDDITEDQPCTLHDLTMDNVSQIATQIWDLSLVNRKPTESDEINGGISSPAGTSLDMAANKLSSNEWNPVNKDSIFRDNYARETNSSCDPQESHNSFRDSMKSFDYDDCGSSLSSSGKDGTVRIAEDFPKTEDANLMVEKLSSKLQVVLPTKDGGQANIPGNRDSLQKDRSPSSLPEKFATDDFKRRGQNACLQIPGMQCSAVSNDNNQKFHSVPCVTKLKVKQSSREITQPVDGNNVETKLVPSSQSDGHHDLHVGSSPLPNVFMVRESPRQEGLVNQPQSTQSLQAPSQLPTPSPSSTFTENSQILSYSNLSVPMQESCNMAERELGRDRAMYTESCQGVTEQDSQLSYATSYQQAYCSIRCQKCNQTKDNVRLFSIVPHQTGLASPTSVPLCFSIPNSSGPEAMTFSYSLCRECSQDVPFIDIPIRQNSFSSTNGTLDSSNLFPPALEHSVPDLKMTQQAYPIHTSNLEKGSESHLQRDAIPRHQSSPSRLNYMQQQPTNNFGQPEFRREILDLDQRMRHSPVPTFQRNIPVNSNGTQQSNTDNTKVPCPPLSAIPGSFQNTQSKSFQSHSLNSRSFQRQGQNSGSCPTLQNPHSFGGASSGMPAKPYNKIYGNDCAAGASDACGNYDHLPLMDLSHIVIEYIQSQLDFAGSSLNWERLAHLHGWNFGMIYTIKQKWQKRVIESPFLELIQNSQNFQNYTFGQLKMDLERIPRKDILEKLREFEEKEELVV